MNKNDYMEAVIAILNHFGHKISYYYIWRTDAYRLMLTEIDGKKFNTMTQSAARKALEDILNAYLESIGE